MFTVGTFNLENLFTRPRAMNAEDVPSGGVAVEDHARANLITQKATYSPADKAELAVLAERYGWDLPRPPRTSLVQLQKIRGRLFKQRAPNTPPAVVATGRDNWVGWFELLREDLAWESTYNTARTIAEVDPDILLAVEMESRPTLDRFNEQVLGASFNVRYPHVMVIDGNDPRGIDVGVMSRFPIEAVRSHIDDQKNGKRIFARDCPEYDLRLPTGDLLVVLPCHFKSKYGGNSPEAVAKRTLEARTAHAIARSAEARTPYVLVGGDFNDIPSSTPLKPLFTKGFRDASHHPTYPKGRPGTYKTGRASHKIDYLVASKALDATLDQTDLKRRGSYHPTPSTPFDTVTSATTSASEHHLL